MGISHRRPRPLAGCGGGLAEGERGLLWPSAGSGGREAPAALRPQRSRWLRPQGLLLPRGLKARKPPRCVSKHLGGGWLWGRGWREEAEPFGEACCHPEVGEWACLSLELRAVVGLEPL